MSKIYYVSILTALLSSGTLMASHVENMDSSNGPSKTSKLTDFSALQKSINDANLDKPQKRKAISLLNKIAETELTLQQVQSVGKTGENSRESMLLTNKLDSYKSQLDSLIKPKKTMKD